MQDINVLQTPLEIQRMDSKNGSCFDIYGVDLGASSHSNEPVTPTKEPTWSWKNKNRFTDSSIANHSGWSFQPETAMKNHGLE